MFLKHTEKTCYDIICQMRTKTFAPSISQILLNFENVTMR